MNTKEIMRMLSSILKIEVERLSVYEVLKQIGMVWDSL